MKCNLCADFIDPFRDNFRLYPILSTSLSNNRSDP